MIPVPLHHEKFHWSSPSAFLSAVLLINVTTCLSALYAWRLTKKSTLYPTLAAVAIAHVLDFYLSVLSAGSIEGNGSKFALTVISYLCATIGGTGYQAISIARYWTLGKARLPRTSQGLLVLAGLSILLCVANNIVYIYGAAMELFAGDGQMTEVGTQFFVVWSIFDSLIAGATSVAFVILLRRMATPSANGKELRPGLRRLLGNMICLLAFEVIMMLAANLVVRLAEEHDPYWLTLYTSEAIRMILCSSFLVSLNRLLRNKQVAQPLASGLLASGRPASALSKAPSGAGLPTLGSMAGGGAVRNGVGNSTDRELNINTSITKQDSVATGLHGSKGQLLSPSSAAQDPHHLASTPIGGEAARLLP